MANILDLAARGSGATRRFCKALLIGSIMANKRASKYLSNSGYVEKSREKVKENVRARNISKANAAEKQGVALTANQFEEETCNRTWTRPLSNWKYNKQLQLDFIQIKEGPDPEIFERATKVSFAKADCFALFVANNCQYRPGKSRNSKLQGVQMVKLPYYIRYRNLLDLHQQYKVFTGDLAIGRDLFVKALRAVTKTGTFNSVLSYFWVDFIELIKLVDRAIGRLEELSKQHLKHKEATQEAHDEIKKVTTFGASSISLPRCIFDMSFTAVSQNLTPMAMLACTMRWGRNAPMNTSLTKTANKQP
jgi:hypothetical protein